MHVEMTGEIRNLWIIATPCVLSIQAFCAAVDEFYCHRRRKLGRFESFSHPIDTISYCLALLLPAFASPTPQNLVAYAVLSFTSSLIVTKDEWLHRKECDGFEHWLHSLMFLLHLPILIGIGHLWWMGEGIFIRKALPIFLGFWSIYQYCYWRRHHVENRRSSTGQQSFLRHLRQQVVR